MKTLLEYIQETNSTQKRVLTRANGYSRMINENLNPHTLVALAEDKLFLFEPVSDDKIIDIRPEQIFGKGSTYKVKNNCLQGVINDGAWSVEAYDFKNSRDAKDAYKNYTTNGLNEYPEADKYSECIILAFNQYLIYLENPEYKQQPYILYSYPKAIAETLKALG